MSSETTRPAGFGQPGRLGVHFTLAAPVPKAYADLPVMIRVRLQNTGTITWPNSGPNPINLSYHWLDAHGTVVDYDGVRTPLPEPLPPGGVVELDLPAEPPPGPGQYLLMLDMVEEWVGWFSAQAIDVLTVPVEVLPVTLRGPRACIIGPLCLVNDAVSNAMIDQLHMLRNRGYHALILVEHIDLRQPPALRQYMLGMSFDDLTNGTITALNRRAQTHVAASDLFFFHYPNPYDLFEAITTLDHGVAIVDYHGVTPAALHESASDAALFERRLRRHFAWMRHADYAIAHSAYTRAELLQTGMVSPERVFQMGYTVALDRFAPAAKPARLLERYGVRADQPVLLYVGRMAANKRIVVLVRALASIRQRCPDAVLLLVGNTSNPAYAPIIAQAKYEAAALGFADAVIFTGMVPDAELPDHYRLADVFVTASLHEGFCIPVIESMASGVPPIGARATALPETIGTGGLTFTPDDPADLATKVLRVLGAE